MKFEYRLPVTKETSWVVQGYQIVIQFPDSIHFDINIFIWM